MDRSPQKEERDLGRRWTLERTDSGHMGCTQERPYLEDRAADMI